MLLKADGLIVIEAKQEEKLGTLEYGRSGFDDVTVGADGGIVTAWQSNRDDIVVFDPNGKLVRTIPEAISGAVATQSWPCE